MPYSINPEKGYLVTANNPIIRPDFKHSNSFPAISFVDRAYRISQLIEENIKSGIKMTVKDVLKI